MRLQRPLVSIIVPSFNQGKYIRETIDSVLSQDYRPLEILVVDGASKDSTVEVLKSYGNFPELQWWSERDRGVVDAVNKGFKRAQGEIIGIQSSDDAYRPGAISAAVDCFCARADVALVYGDVEFMDQNSRFVETEMLPPFDMRRYLGRFLYIPQPAAFFRASVLPALGGWREEVSYAADADLWMRIAASHKVAKLDRALGRCRLHAEQREKHGRVISRDWETMVRDLMAAHSFDGETRHYARMGIHLAHYRYLPESAWARRTWHLYRAALANPGAVFDKSFPKREFLIGRQPIWNCLSRVKRSLGFSPRSL